MPSASPHQYQSWLDAHLLADSLSAEAYESLSGEERAVLKKCIARLHVVWGESSLRESRNRSFRQGFGIEEDDAPATYALLACEVSYPSPAVFLAAVLPVLLAGVSGVFACFVFPKGRAVSARDIPAPLLGALELAGVERSFAASEADVLELAEMLRAGSGRGRIVILGNPGFGEGLALHAHRTGVLCRSLTQPPLYHNGRLCAVVEQRFMEKSGEPADAAACRDDDSMFLHLDAPHEDIWFWPKLGPDWFRTRRMRIFALR